MQSTKYNFYDPETQKVDPAKWDSAFKYAIDNNLTPKQVKAFLETMTPYGTKSRKVAAVITNKASLNRGVPKYNSAFEGKEPEGDDEEESENGEEGEEKKIHSASRNRNVEVPKYMNLMRTIVRDNNLD